MSIYEAIGNVIGSVLGLIICLILNHYYKGDKRKMKKPIEFEVAKGTKELLLCIADLEAQIEKMKRCEICKHYQDGSCNYHYYSQQVCKENGMKLFELKEIKEK